MSIKTNLGLDDRLLASLKRARALLDCGNTQLYALMNSGELDSVWLGRSRKITVESIQRLIARRLTAAAELRAASHAPDEHHVAA
jgi:hypothetical protein